MAFIAGLPDGLAAFGLPFELAPGWETRGSADFDPACVVDHRTVGPPDVAEGERPSPGSLTEGRPAPPGPLCNVYLARDGVCVVVAAGRANHAGSGGFRDLVGNSAAYGVTAESSGEGDWSKAQVKAYPILNAALVHGLGRDASWVCGHNEWAPGRKTDIQDWPMDAM